MSQGMYFIDHNPVVSDGGAPRADVRYIHFFLGLRSDQGSMLREEFLQIAYM